MTTRRQKSSAPVASESPRPEGSADWRERTIARVRALVLQAVPGVVEEVKWRKPSNPAGVPVWSSDGVICTGETYRSSVKVTFAQGAALPDPAGVFNAGLDGGTRRAIDIREGDDLDEMAFKALVRAAAARNASATGPRAARSRARIDAAASIGGMTPHTRRPGSRVRSGHA